MSGFPFEMSRGWKAWASSTLVRSLAACIAGSFVLRCAAFASGQVLALYLAEIDRTLYSVAATKVGLMAASFYLAELLTAPLFGAQSDRQGRRRFMVLGGLFGAMALPLMGLTAALPLLLIVRVLEGFSTGSSAPATLGYLSSTTSRSPAFRGRVMSIYEVASVVGMASGVLVAGVLWDRIGRASLFVLFALYCLSMILFWQVREKGIAAMPNGRGLIQYLSLATHPKMLRFVPAWLAVNAVVGLWFSHATFQFTAGDDVGQRLSGSFTGGSVGVVFATFGILFTVGIFLWGFAFGRIKKTTIMLVSLGGLFSVAAGIYAVNRAPDGHPLTLVSLVVLLGAALMIASGFTPAALAYLADISEEYVEDRGIVMGMYSVFLAIGQLVGGFVGGPFADEWGVDGLVLLTVILGFIAAFTVLSLRRWEHRARLLAAS